MEWVFSLVPKVRPKLENPILIEGLPGIGNVGKIATDFMIDKMGAEKLYTVFSHYLPHSVFINENNLVELPKIEIYYKKFRKKRDVLFLVGDTQPIDEPSCYSFCEQLIHVIGQYHCKEIITTGGIGLNDLPKEPKIFITGSSKKIVKKYKNPMLNDKLYGHVGPIIGVTGVLVAIAKIKKIEAISLLGETLGNPMFVGVKTSKKILNYFNEHFAFNLNLNYLDKEIKEMETELKAIDELEMIQHQENLPKHHSDIVSYIG